MYSIHNEGKCVVAERFIRTLKAKTYRCMTSIPKNMYINKLDDIVNEYNNTNHRTIKIKPVDVKDNIYIDPMELPPSNDKDLKFKVGDPVRISKYKNIFTKWYTPNCSEEVFVIKKVKNTVPLTYCICDLNGKKMIATFYEKELQKANQKEFRIENNFKKVTNYMSNEKLIK